MVLVPATKRAEKFLHDLTRKARAPPLHQPTAHAASEALKQLQLAGLGPLQHCLLAYRVFLEGEHFQALLLRFLSLVAAWLLHLGDGAEGAPAKFALLPEACVTALCEVRVRVRVRVRFRSDPNPDPDPNPNPNPNPQPYPLPSNPRQLLIVTARTAPSRLAGHPAAAAIVSRFCCDALDRRDLLAPLTLLASPLTLHLTLPNPP